MKQIRLNSPLVPPSLRGTVGCDDRHIPYFWLTRWIQLCLFAHARSTRETATRALLQLHATAYEVNGTSLDITLMSLDFPKIRICLNSHLQKLNNDATRRKVDLTKRWAWCITFLEYVLEYLGKIEDDRWLEIKWQVRMLQTAYSNFSFDGRDKQPAPLRSLPSIVVSDLYEIFNPGSARNPFRCGRTRSRNYLIFLTLLQTGIRRSEMLLLYVNSVNAEFDDSAGRLISWMMLSDLDDDQNPKSLIDPRSPAPSLKNPIARRILPISEELLEAYEEYLEARPASNWPFLFLSQRGRPLSVRQVNEIFLMASGALRADAVRALHRQGKANVQPHDLRHTCAVRRLVGYCPSGNLDAKAIEKLRVFFGWNEKSVMPMRYARAYFETESDTVRQDNYDNYVTAIRTLEHLA